MGVCRETISDWKGNQDFKSMLNAERERLVVVNRERLGTLFEKACARASELMDSNDERVSLYATLGVLKTLKDVALPVQSVSEKKESVDAQVLFGMLNQLGALKGLPNSEIRSKLPQIPTDPHTFYDRWRCERWGHGGTGG